MKLIDLTDILLFAGLALVGAGLWFFDFRVALVVDGALMVGLGVLRVCMESRPAPKTARGEKR